MLVLTIEKEGSIMVGDIEVKVCDIRKGKVKIGVEAPRSVPVHRRKIYDLINCA